MRFSKAQIRMVQLGGPPPFRHPVHIAVACREPSPFMNSLKLKSFGTHFSSP